MSNCISCRLTCRAGSCRSWSSCPWGWPAASPRTPSAPRSSLREGLDQVFLRTQSQGSPEWSWTSTKTSARFHLILITYTSYLSSLVYSLHCACSLYLLYILITYTLCLFSLYSSVSLSSSSLYSASFPLRRMFLLQIFTKSSNTELQLLLKNP